MPMDCMGFAIGELLPHEYRGDYGEDVCLQDKVAA